MLTKDQIKYITKNIQPDEASYVFNAANVMNNAANVECTGKECNPVDFPDAILLVNQLIAISNKLLDCHTCIRSNDYRNYIQELQWSLRDYIQEFIKKLKLLYGFDTNIVSSDFKLPLDNDPIEIVNVLKELLNKYLNEHQNDNSDLNRVINDEMTHFLSKVINSVYYFRMASLDAKAAQGTQTVPDIVSPYDDKVVAPVASAPMGYFA